MVIASHSLLINSVVLHLRKQLIIDELIEKLPLLTEHKPSLLRSQMLNTRPIQSQLKSQQSFTLTCIGKQGIQITEIKKGEISE
jgi:hypothetical protein